MNKEKISEDISTENIEYVAEQVKLGDKQGYTIIINRFQKQIYIYCYYLLGNKEDAEDATQDIFIKGFENIYNFTSNVSFSAWIYKIASNHCINLIKRKSRFYNVLKQYKNQESQIYAPDHTEIIHELLDQLNSEEKHILLLRAVEEYTFEEISIIMNLKAATIRKKYERIRKKLHKFIKKKGGELYMGKYIGSTTDSEINQVEELIRETSVEVNLTNRIMEQIETGSSKSFRSIKTRKKNGPNKIIIMMSTAAAAFVIMLGGSFISPTMAVSMKQIPGMSSIFMLAGDFGLKTADEKGLVTKLSVGDTHNNLTLNVPVVMYDGTRVSIGLEHETSESKFSNKSLGELISSVNLSIDGRPIQSFAPDNSNSIGIYLHPGKDQNSVILEFSDLHNQGGKLLPDKFNLSLMVTVEGIKEPFEIDFPVKKNIDDYLVMQPNISREYENFNFTLEKFESTPITTSITTSIDLPINSKLTMPVTTMGVDLFDDKGNRLKMLSGNGWNETDGNFLVSDYRFQPFELTPKYITIKPYIHLYQDKDNRVFQIDKDGNAIIKYIPELEINLPIRK